VVLRAFQGGASFDLLAGLWFLVWLHVSSGAFRGSSVRGKIQGAGLCGFYLLYGAKTKRRETVSGGGLLCHLSGVCVSLSPCRTIGARLPLSVWYRGAAQTFVQVYETSVRR
jgi:hypothetical protein